MVVSAACAEAAVVKPAVPTPPVKVPPLLKPEPTSVVVETIEFPVSGGPAAPGPETLEVKVAVDAPATAEADAFATVLTPYATPAPGPPFTALARFESVADVLAPINTSLAAPLSAAT